MHARIHARTHTSTRGTITGYTCDNLTRFVYLLHSIEGVFDNYFLVLWWSAEMTPSAEYMDQHVLPFDNVLLEYSGTVLLKLVARLCYLSW